MADEHTRVRRVVAVCHHVSIKVTKLLRHNRKLLEEEGTVECNELLS